jgi:signal transduction histidine kinase
MRHLSAAWRRLSPTVRDAIISVVVAVVLVYGSYGEGHPSSPSDRIQFHGHSAPHPPLAALLLVVAACLVLAWRHRWPLAVLAVSIAAASAYSLLGYVNGAVLVAPFLALYAVARQVSIRWSVAAAVITVVVLGLASAARNPFGHFNGGSFDLLPFLGAAALFAGIAVANREAYVRSIHDRAQQEAQRRIDEERLRIARELHDVVAHTMATINVQAGAAAHVLSTRPETAGEALQAIKAASKQGLQELRAILNVLRQADEADPTQPAPGAAQLETLIAGACQAGVETTLTVTGEPGPLPAAVDLAAYRIVQESLTNTIRHAGPATASVTLSYLDSELAIEVTDTGLGSAASTFRGGTGHGIAGMRERAAAVGGLVDAGPAPGGGFHVTARLPRGGRLSDSAPTPATEATRS